MNGIYVKLFHIACLILVTNSLNVGDDCQVARSGAKGVCKIINECVEVIDDIRKNNLYPTQCGFRGRDQIVCCPVKIVIKPTVIPDATRISQKSM